MSEKTVIEINGVKLEVDLRHAKRIDDLKVGDRVKVLIKEYSNYKVYPGTVVGFEPFKELPTIIVAYVKKDYSEVSIQFLYFNSQTKDTEMVKAIDGDMLGLEKDIVLKKMDAEILKKEEEVNELKRKKAYFLENFNCYWADFETAMKSMEKQLEGDGQ